MITPLLLCLSVSTGDANWPRFRGPEGAGVAHDGASYPEALDPEENLIWKTALPRGHSSPCVWGQRIFLTAEGDEGTLETLCLARDSGKILWRRAVEIQAQERLHEIHSAATPTPCTDGQHVISYFGSLGLIGYDLEGEELWRHEVPAARNSFGTSISPVMVDGVVLFLRDVSGASFLEALDPANGEVIWRVERTRFGSGWSTPGVRRTGGVTELLVYGPEALVAYDLADGRELWSVPGLTDEPIITPTCAGDLVFVSSYNMKTNTEVIGVPAFSEILAALDRDGDGTLDAKEAEVNQSVLSRHDADGEGDHPLSMFFSWMDADKDGQVNAEEYKTLEDWVDSFAHLNGLLAIRPGDGERPAEIVWQHGRGVPECPSPLVYQGRIYFVKNGGVITCLDAESGELRFQGRTDAGGPCYASPVAADGKLYLCSARGQITVLRAGDELELLSSTELEERVMATPALVDGQVFLRTEQHLYAFR